MKNIKLFILYFFLFNSLLSCSQTKYSVQNARAYYSVRLPGTLLVDDSGNPVQKEPNVINFIYVETKKGEAINWTLAQKKNKLYSVIATPIERTPYEVGISKATNRKIILSPAKGNSLWQLELVPNESKTLSRITKENTNAILLQGEFKKQKFTIKVDNETELSEPDAV